MNHSYLSEKAINEALAKRAITKKEAKKLNKKIHCQAIIFQSTKTAS
jgi:hypothetical protein